jgi:hypothetical protein
MLLFRGPVLWIFEHGGEVYLVSQDFALRGELYLVTRSGRDRAAKWRVQFRFRFPGRPLGAWRRGHEIALTTDAGIVAIDESGHVRAAHY